jgi:large subunit ribosomal protein L10
MKRSDKQTIIDSLTKQINSSNHFYLADISDLNASVTSDLRRTCFRQNIKLVVAKNTLLRKAFEKSGRDFHELYDVLKGNTSVMFTETASTPAKLIKDFSKKHKRPILKGAYVEESVYIGENQLEALIAIKSKNELIADVIALLKSPMTTVLSQLQSGGNIIHGVLKTLGERE